jgi:hypothetical protein
MLAAMASFVLHGVAMAGGHRHGPTTLGCDPADHAPKVAKGFAHTHADGTRHVHHSSDDVGSAQGEGAHQHAEGGACCGKLCPVAIISGPPDTPSAPLRSADALLVADQNGSGTSASGLRRPPRTTDIA